MTAFSTVDTQIDAADVSFFGNFGPPSIEHGGPRDGDQGFGQTMKFGQFWIEWIFVVLLSDFAFQFRVDRGTKDDGNHTLGVEDYGTVVDGSVSTCGY